MKTPEEPPYLTVGTDVSAKYRGAFCEAKIKTAKRLVKAKVTFKPDLTTAEVHDDSIQGPLKVGAVVEVKNPDGVYQEASINKLTDCSIYTVVFDDGDEKTLRRSSLCLKGARHYAESETLDRLPLTNPEHFGTPVIGKKGNRGRRSNPVQEEESSSSSSEEEDSDGRQNEDLYGKVVCVEVGPASTADRKTKTTAWYPALVITPDCHEEATIKKDTVFVRSFKDGKFNTVLRKDVTVMDTDSPPKADAGLKPVLDAAVEFVHQAVVPGSWRTEVKDESSTSEEDEEEEEQEEEASEEEDEEEVEPFPEERDNFLQQLYKFMEDRGTPINKKPVLGYRNLDLFKLYRLVHQLGGFHDIESGSVWKTVYQALGIPVLNSAAGYNVKCAYRKYLYGFEEYCTSCAITFRMDLPLKQPKAEGGKAEGETGEAGGDSSVPPVASSSSAEEQKRKACYSERENLCCSETSSTQPIVCKEETELTRNKPELEPLKAEREVGDDDDDDDGVDEEGNDHHKHGSDNEDGPSFARLREEGVKLEPYDEEQEAGKEEDISGSGDESCSQEGDGGDEDLGEEGEEFECYPPGMKVQVRYGRGRSLKTYQATVKEADVEGGEVLYLVHYCGWNVRYDEWVKADKIVRPANKNVQKIKHRKKIKNKAERERNRLEQLNEDLGSPSPNRLRVPRPSSKSLGPCSAHERHVFSKMEDGENQRTLTLQSPVKSIEITSILNGLQASESSTDESDQDGGREDDDDHPGSGGRGSLRKGGPLKPLHALDHWEGTASTDVPKPPLVTGKSQQPISVETPESGKRRSQLEFEAEREGPGSSACRKRKSEGVAGEQQTSKGPPSKTKLPTRSTRSADWLPGSSNRRAQERTGGLGEDRGGAGGSSSSSSDDGGATPTEPHQADGDRPSSRPKPSPSKKYNGMKDKGGTGGGGGARPAGFWEIPEKRAKMASSSVEERERERARLAGGSRTKGQKDVWSSIQAQWPKKTLKELFSDSDTEAANSPPPPGPAQSSSSCHEERESRGERDGDEAGVGGPERESRGERDGEGDEAGGRGPEREIRGERGGEGDEAGGGPEREDHDLSEENQGQEKRRSEQEFPSSGSNSVLNTPPTTPESPSMGHSSSGAMAQGAGTGSNRTQPSCPPLSVTPALGTTPSSDPLAPGRPNTLAEEGGCGRSETDSSTVEVESLGGELQDQDLPPPDQEQGEPHHHGGTGSLSSQSKVSLLDGPGSLSSSHSHSNSTCSLELSSSSRHDNTEHKAKVSASHKRQKEQQAGGAAKKPKPNRKSSVPPKKNNNRKTAHSSDSEDQSLGESTAKSSVSKTHGAADMKGSISPKCPGLGQGRTLPSSQKYHKQHGDPDHHHHLHSREHHREPDLDKMSSLERISFLQEKLQDIRNHYLSLKSEVASIDRRRKRIKKKERESTVAASSSSSSSPSSSSLTAAVMLTLADTPVSSSSSSQNSVVSVECR
ncbi:AT-rich interactive domain-containing protein 4B-like isoform X4 [Oncorhynchus keta]|uniref:AT-rich interactive domain-containing protein 4B-like isoform X4 n=1 Tax=Oncorhynchus keta TaxID=8018 RepID=UPI00227B6711|nr:AT-rich interactive domain-containing protein 4B-like isoform X4 [Oncorhynchus keta]